MPDPKQLPRHIAIDSPLGEDVLLLRGMSIREEISRLPEIHLDLLSEDPEIDFDGIIGKNVTLRMDLPDGGRRHWNGFINGFEQGRSTSVQFAQYRATMAPWLWFLTRTSDCRIFQEMTVPDIVKQVCSDLGFSDIEERLSSDYRQWTYCVQYRETDFNFINRLMEQEGIYYYFTHEPGKATIVLVDTASNHDPYGGYETIDYLPDTRSSSQQERISEWLVHKSVRTGRFALNDYNFLKPSTALMSVEDDPKSHDRADYEFYDFPGEFEEKVDGDSLAKLRLEELAMPHEICSGRSDARGICAGCLFTLDKHPRRDQNREYLIVSTDYRATAEDYETAGGLDDLCACSFTAIPSQVPFRPARTTPRPKVHGTQTAVVTGPAGEEIFTDEHGRIKVQFHWDRVGQYDDKSSCWIRVRQNWAGSGWGGLHIPRIGQEVIVDFLEGDPDRPLVVGAVYNAGNMPPYDLPAEKTKSTLKSNSTLGGGGFNEFRFEDKKGSEEVYLHGQKNWTIAIENNKNQTVGNDETHSVGHDRTKTVHNDQSETIGVNKTIKVGTNHTETIGSMMTQTVGNSKAETITVAKALTIGTAYQVTVGGAMNETVGAAKAEEVGGSKAVGVAGSSVEGVGGNKSVTVGKSITESAGKDISVTSGKEMSLTAKDNFRVSGGKKAVVEIKDELQLKCGKATLTMKKSGDILINGKKIQIKGSGNVIIKGKKILEN
jgi:type VI secretion system secreted protein VgrG